MISLFIKSFQCAYFHKISLGKVDDRRERGRPIITLKDMVLARCWWGRLNVHYTSDLHAQGQG